MSKIEFNGIELELDLMDADVMEKFEDGLAKTAEDVKEKSQYAGKKNNLEDHMTAFGKAANMVGQVQERTKEITSQYAPERVQNRAERRANKGKKGNKVKYMNNAARNR